MLITISSILDILNANDQNGGADKVNRVTLEKQLARRPTRQELVKRHILLSGNFPCTFNK